MKRTPFVIFAHARSGSSNLLRALQQHGELHVAEEPFHERYNEWNPGEPDYRSLTQTILDLRAHLADLFARFDGFKTLDYQLSEDLYEDMLLREDLRVIFLQRRNLLQATVSNFIARQTDIWKIWNLHGTLEDAYRDVRPLPIPEMRDVLNYLAETRAHFTAVMDRKPADMQHRIVYEDFYTDDPGRNRQNMGEVFAFIGLRMPDARLIDDLLLPSASKINGAATYRLFPNIEEVEHELGCDETGWLFR